jgi:hypothetical protein
MKQATAGCHSTKSCGSQHAPPLNAQKYNLKMNIESEDVVGCFSIFGMPESYKKYFKTIESSTFIVPISVTMGQCYKTWYGHNS